MADRALAKAKTYEILVVDDILANLQLLSDILIKQGYKVRPASSGQLALKSVAVRLPDLILLDVKMPGMDGYEVCRILKGDEDTHRIPVIFVSALDEPTDKVRGFNLGGVDYITKPFQPEEVLARVESHLTISKMQVRLKEQNLLLQQEIQALIKKNPMGHRRATIDVLKPAKDDTLDVCRINNCFRAILAIVNHLDSLCNRKDYLMEIYQDLSEIAYFIMEKDRDSVLKSIEQINLSINELESEIKPEYQEKNAIIRLTLDEIRTHLQYLRIQFGQDHL